MIIVKTLGPLSAWVVPSSGGDARRLTRGNPLTWWDGGRAVLFVRDHKIWRHDIASGKDAVVRAQKVPADGTNGSMVGDVRPDLNAAVFRTDKNRYFDFAQNKVVIIPL